MTTCMDKIIYYENILEFKENTHSQLQYREVKNWNLCRTCLQETQATDSTDFSGNGICVMGIDGQLLNVKDMLTSATGLQISDNDRLPAKICKACLSKISALHFFKLQTQRAETILQRMLAKLDEIKNSEISQKSAPNVTINEADCSSINDIEGKDALKIEINSDHNSQDAELPDSDNEEVEETLKTSEENNDNEEAFDLQEVLYEEERTNESIEEYVYEEYQTDEDTDVNTDVDTVTYSPNVRSEVVYTADDNTSNAEENEKNSNVEEKTLHRKRIKGKAPLIDLTCEICGLSFSQQQLLITHVSQAHPNTKAFKCRTCGHMFSHLQSLSRHMQTHLEKKLKKFCSDCGKSFLRSDDWRRHLRTHTGERPYVCAICQKGFKQISELKEHANTHMRNRRFVCNFCGHCLKSRNGLYLHKKLHEGTKNHMCLHCEKRFITKGELKSHLNVHTKIKKRTDQMDVES